MEVILLGIMDLKYSRASYNLNGCTYELIKNVVTNKEIEPITYTTDINIRQSNNKNNIYVLKDIHKNLIYYMYSSINSTTNLILRNMCVMHNLTLFSARNVRQFMMVTAPTMIFNYGYYTKFNKVNITFEGDIESGILDYMDLSENPPTKYIGIITSPKLNARKYPGYII